MMSVLTIFELNTLINSHRIQINKISKIRDSTAGVCYQNKKGGGEKKKLAV